MIGLLEAGMVNPEVLLLHWMVARECLMKELAT